jgi:hypothetical protein
MPWQGTERNRHYRALTHANAHVRKSLTMPMTVHSSVLRDARVHATVPSNALICREAHPADNGLSSADATTAALANLGLSDYEQRVRACVPQGRNRIAPARVVHLAGPRGVDLIMTENRGSIHQARHRIDGPQLTKLGRSFMRSVDKASSASRRLARHITNNSDVGGLDASSPPGTAPIAGICRDDGGR